MRKSAVFLLLVLTFPLTAGASFTDVPEDHEHYAAIQWMEGRSVIQGYDDGTFRPDQEVNRAEALKIILLGSEIEVAELADDEESAAEPEEFEDLFPDVTATDWYYPYVAKGLELGIVQGYDDGYFLPEQTINLAETLKIISLTRGIETNTPEDDPYIDVGADVWFAEYVEYCKERNFIEAHDDGYLHPDYEVNRGDLTEIMYRFSYVENYDLETFDIALNWTEYQHDVYDYAFKAPFDWEIISGDNGEVILWQQDEDNGQKSWDRTTGNSAVALISVDIMEVEGVSSTDYFNEVVDGLEAYIGIDTVVTTTGTATENYSALLVEYEGDYEKFRDLYIVMPDDVFIVVQATYGTGLLSEQWEGYIEAIQGSIYYSPAPDEDEEEEEEDLLDQDPAETLEEARESIQADGEGQATLDLFPDLELIETDTIGVGTGPVDYYYSAWADVTLKYERSLDVILDIEDGQTTAF